MINQLVLSLFSGIGLLDHQFKKSGFVVVSAGDLITGQDIRDFNSISGRFDGIIAGSPCQDFSGLKRNKTNYSQLMLDEFKRIVIQTNPSWWLLENVSSVPDVLIDGYFHQRLDINQGWYEPVSRLRHIQFGSKNNIVLDIPKLSMHDNCVPLATANDGRSFSFIKQLQGLPINYDLPSFNIASKKRAVGNGVPVSIGSVLANSLKTALELNYNTVTPQRVNSVTPPGIKPVTRLCVNSVTNQALKTVTNRCLKSVTPQRVNSVTLCKCGCKRHLTGRRLYYDATCRKRAQRKRNSVL